MWLKVNPCQFQQPLELTVFMLPNKNFDVPNPMLHHTSPRIHTGQFVILYLYD